MAEALSGQPAGGEGAAQPTTALPSGGQPEGSEGRVNEQKVEGKEPGEQAGGEERREAAAPVRPVRPIQTPEQKKAAEERMKAKARRDNLLGFPTKGDGTEEVVPGLRELRGVPRDPETGQFLPRTPRPAGEQDQPAAEAKPGEEGKPALPAGEKPAEEKPLKFLGKDYKSLGEIEQAHKSLQGMFGHLNTQIKTLTDERDYGYNAARQWEAEARRRGYKDGKNDGKAPQPQADEVPPGNGVAPSDDELLDLLDTDAVEALAVSKGLPLALKFYGEQILGVVKQHLLPSIQRQMADELTPLKAERARGAMAEHANEVVSTVRTLQLPNGQPAFPELQDEKLLPEIGAAGIEGGLQPEFILTPRGLMAAVALYRVKQGIIASGSALPATPTSAPGPAAQPRAAAAIASVAAEPASFRPPHDGRNANLTPAARRIAALFDRPDPKFRDLGFERNARPRA